MISVSALELGSLVCDSGSHMGPCVPVLWCLGRGLMAQGSGQPHGLHPSMSSGRVQKEPAPTKQGQESCHNCSLTLSSKFLDAWEFLRHPFPCLKCPYHPPAILIRNTVKLEKAKLRGQKTNKSVVARDWGWGLWRSWGTFLSDRIVLCLDCGSSYMNACTCQNLHNWVLKRWHLLYVNKIIF